MWNSRLDRSASKLPDDERNASASGEHNRAQNRTRRRIASRSLGLRRPGRDRHRPAQVAPGTWPDFATSRRGYHTLLRVRPEKQPAAGGLAAYWRHASDGGGDRAGALDELDGIRGAGAAPGRERRRAAD